MKDGCFCFSVMDKELHDLHFNTKYEDKTLETLIGTISMKLNEKIKRTGKNSIDGKPLPLSHLDTVLDDTHNFSASAVCVKFNLLL